MIYEIEQKLNKITYAWNSLIIPYQFCRKEIKYEEQELTNYIVGISGYLHDTFEIILETRKCNGFVEMFSNHISFLQAIFIQQELVLELLGLFNLDNKRKSFENVENYSLNRNLRNELIGHPISRDKDKNKELTSVTMISYEQKYDAVDYLRYHRKKCFNGEIITASISEIRNRHLEFLNDNFDKIINKTNEILQQHVEVLDVLLANLSTYDFQKLLIELSNYFEPIYSYTNPFELEIITEIYSKKSEHLRYSNMIDNFLHKVNFSLIEGKNNAISFIKKSEYLPVNTNELVFNYNDLVHDKNYIAI